MCEAAFGDEVEVLLEEALYGATEASLLARLRGSPGRSTRRWSSATIRASWKLAVALSSEGAELARMREKYPTAALATIDLPADSWSALERGSGELVAFVRPRDLG